MGEFGLGGVWRLEAHRTVKVTTIHVIVWTFGERCEFHFEGLKDEYQQSPETWSGDLGV